MMDVREGAYVKKEYKHHASGVGIGPILLLIGAAAIGWYVMSGNSRVTVPGDLQQMAYTMDPEIRQRMAQTSPSRDTSPEQATGSMIVVSSVMAHQMMTSLTDVADGDEIAPGSTKTETLQGITKASYIGEEYRLFASARHLPKLPEGYMYNGWIVRHEPFDVIHTGTLNTFNDEYINVFSSPEDFTTYDVYVVTVDREDADNPGTHVLEGELSST